MQFTIKIDCKNAAFEDVPGVEISRLLRLVAKDVAILGSTLGGKLQVTKYWPDNYLLRDINGNPVGFATFTEN